jgi:hypothetical protein
MVAFGSAGALFQTEGVFPENTSPANWTNTGFALLSIGYIGVSDRRCLAFMSSISRNGAE